MNIGDTVYIVRHHIKNHKNIGYYIDECRLCGKSSKYLHVDHNIGNYNDIPTKTAKRMYIKSRIHENLEDAQKECDFKNKIIEIRNKYNQDINKIKEGYYGI